MLRLTGSARSVAEVVAIAEHIASLTAAAAAFQLNVDVPIAPTDERPAPLIPLIDELTAGESAATLEQIRGWASGALGVDRVPAIWRALAHDPRLLESTWRKDQLVRASGVLDELVKGCAALAVAQFRQSAYWIRYLTQYLRIRCQLDDRGLVEIAGAVMHYISFNTMGAGLGTPEKHLAAIRKFAESAIDKHR